MVTWAAETRRGGVWELAQVAMKSRDLENLYL